MTLTASGAPIHHPRTCGPCDDCREALRDYATIPAYAEQLPKRSQEERDEAAFWERLSRPFTPPGLNPDAVGRSMRHACGTLAGEYARRFWTSRIAADKAAVPFTIPTAEQLRRHEQKFMPHERTQQAQHREAVRAVADTYDIDLDERDDPVVLAKRRTRKHASTNGQNKRGKDEIVVEGVAN
jgi:hypothetical protein